MIPTVKDTVRSALGKAGIQIRRIPRTQRSDNDHSEYVRAGRIPWSRGYTEARARFISTVLADPVTLERFREAEELPAGFGVGLDERCIEYPWVIAHLRGGPTRLLDAGSTLNHAFILDHPLLQTKTVYILTLAPESECFWHKGISYLYDDLRKLPFREDWFDSVACISTLEHVGCDNTMYTHNDADREDASEGFSQAMAELRRVLRPGGTCLVSVPYGVYRHFGTFQHFDRQLLRRAVEAFGEAPELVQTYYRYGAAGWNVADAASCANAEYVGWVADASSNGQLPTPLPIEPDRAAAARAVACVRLTK